MNIHLTLEVDLPDQETLDEIGTQLANLLQQYNYSYTYNAELIDDFGTLIGNKTYWNPTNWEDPPKPKDFINETEMEIS
jgi:hypothetical protein